MRMLLQKERERERVGIDDQKAEEEEGKPYVKEQVKNKKERKTQVDTSCSNVECKCLHNKENSISV